MFIVEKSLTYLCFSVCASTKVSFVKYLFSFIRTIWPFCSDKYDKLGRGRLVSFNISFSACAKSKLNKTIKLFDYSRVFSV